MSDPAGTPIDKFVEMVDEYEASRAEVISNVLGLMQANAYAALLAMLRDPQIRPCLREEEVVFLKEFVRKEEGGPTLLN